MTRSRAQCPQKRIAEKIARAQIEQKERSQAEGHQPWRNDPKMVADVALMSAEKNLDPRTVQTIPSTHSLTRRPAPSFGTGLGVAPTPIG